MLLLDVNLLQYSTAAAYTWFHTLVVSLVLTTFNTPLDAPMPKWSTDLLAIGLYLLQHTYCICSSKYRPMAGNTVDTYLAILVCVAAFADQTTNDGVRHYVNAAAGQNLCSSQSSASSKSMKV